MPSNIIVGSGNFTPTSQKIFLINNISQSKCSTNAKYSDSVLNEVTRFCFLELQDLKPPHPSKSKLKSFFFISHLPNPRHLKPVCKSMVLRFLGFRNK